MSCPVARAPSRLLEATSGVAMPRLAMPTLAFSNLAFPNLAFPTRAFPILAMSILAASTLAMSMVAAPIAAQQADPPIAGIWIPDPGRSDRFPADPPYTAEGRRIVEEWRATHDPVEDDPGRFCQAPGMPSVALGGGGYPIEILVTESQVTILMEAHQQARRIFLGEPHPARPFPQRNGHSVGRWDGDTLVVDTVAIKAITFGAVPHSDQAHVVERIRAIDDGAALVNELTITDPAMYTETILLEQYYEAAPEGTRMLEYECTEGMWIEHTEGRGIGTGIDAGPG